MVIPIGVKIIDDGVDLMKASKSYFFQFLEFLEIASFKITSSIILIVSDASVRIIDATIDI